MSRHADLLDQLARYEPADALERGHYDDMVKLLTTSPDAFSRTHFAPGHVTAGCFIVDPSTNALLLHHHRRLGRWLQMGGHPEEDELALDAALREGREESGLDDLALVVDGIFDVDVHFIPAAKGEPDHRHFDVRYVVRSAKPHAIAIARDESNDLAWVPFDRAEALMNEEASSRALRKIRSRL
jgi:8-oxo-dGTP pyrophosphatase MutT (NUDIX family)